MDRGLIDDSERKQQATGDSDMISQRLISEPFMTAFKSGLLSPILQRIQSDDTLMLGLRGSYINIYYRGGSILKLVKAGDRYGATTDKSYLKNTALSARSILTTDADVSDWLAAVPHLKSAMDIHLTTKHATEREFQQLVAWENNRSPIANETEYFITDVEFADQEAGARLDMLGVRWRGHERQSQQALVPVLIEMKYGNKALDGTSGLREHLKDITGLLEKKSLLLKNTIKGQFDQLRAAFSNTIRAPVRLTLTFPPRPGPR